MIPLFPEFKKIEASDRMLVEAFTHQQPPYSDFNFTSLWAWDTSNERMISTLNDNLVVLFTDYETHEPFLSFLGTTNIEDTVRSLMEYSRSSGLSPVLRLVPEEVIPYLKKDHFEIIEDRDNFDYIYSIEELAALRGSRLKSKRQSAQRFSKAHPDAVFKTGDLTDKDLQTYMIFVLRNWELKKIKESKEYELKYEEETIRRLLKTADSHELIVGAIFLRGEMVAFSIDEMLPSQYCIEHFSKAHHDHSGTYDFLNLKMAEHLLTLGAAQWNWEQDLGIKTLASSKMSYRPQSFLRKFKISPK